MMRAKLPKKSTLSPLDPQRVKLANLVDPKHPLVILASEINWDFFESEFGKFYSEDQGRPAHSTRLLVGLHYLKYSQNMSDEVCLQRFSENPYYQYFCGNEYFEHKAPCHSTTFVKWRHRIGIRGAEKLLKETIELAKAKKLFTDCDMKHVNIDTTVQEKAIAYPTDSRIFHKMRQRLVVECRKLGIVLRQNYIRVGAKAFRLQALFSHQKKNKLANKNRRKLKTYLGRVIRDIRRKVQNPCQSLECWLSMAEGVLKRSPQQKDKIYSVHAPEVACIPKGKSRKKYEFGSKVSIAATSKSSWVLAVQSFHGNPHDGNTLSDTLWMIKNLHGKFPERAFVDQGYQGFGGYAFGTQVQIVNWKKRFDASLTSWMRRRSAVEPVIGHLKNEHRLGRNFLLGHVGDGVNAILAGCGFNFAKLARAVSLCLNQLVLIASSRLAVLPSSLFFAHPRPI